MTDENVTPEDIQDTVEGHVEDVKDNAREKFDDVYDRVKNLSTNQKLLITGGAVLVTSLLVQRVINHVRALRVHIDEVDIFMVVNDASAE